MELKEKIEFNEQKLEKLLKKKENIEREILTLQAKISNQKFALENVSKVK